MAPSKSCPYTLTYFNLRGRAEIIRLLFRAAGQTFEDVRISPQQWPTLKPSTPFGTLPVLEIEGGQQISQTHAIARYVARKFGYAGKTNVEEALVDAFVDQIFDAFDPIARILHEKDEGRKVELHKVATENLILRMQPIENHLSGREFLVGTEVTMSDLRLFTALDFSLATKSVKQETLDSFPNVVAHSRRISELPRLREWIAERPITGY